MHAGEIPTKAAVWLALCGYAAGEGMRMLAQRDPNWTTRARWAWTFGCGFFLVHVACAFSFYHGWSHTVAYVETARRTGELTGWRWGGGIYLNYALALLWLGDVLWWWAAPERFARRSARLSAAWHWFFAFMVFNGAAVFGRGPVQWFGALIFASLGAIWWGTKPR
jgi:hypothetical protein